MRTQLVLLVLAFLLLLIVAAGCDATSDSVFTPQIVVQGYLYANEPLDSIVIRHTMEITDTGHNDRVSGAKVTIDDGTTTYTLREDDQAFHRGHYVPSAPLIPKPGVRYSIRVEALGQVATAATTIPQPIAFDSVKLRGRPLSLSSIDTVAYPSTLADLGGPGIECWWSEATDAKGYALEAVSQDTSADPILVQLPNRIPDSTSFGRYRYLILHPHEQVNWLQFRKYGLNAVRALALDRNYEDFILGLYLGGSQFNNQTLHVENGLGVFGSAARASKQVFLQ